MQTNVWTHRVYARNILHNDSLTVEQKRDKIVAALRKSRWLEDENRTSYVDDLIDELSDTTTVEEFDCVWDEIYNAADRDRVWIETF